MHRREKPVTYTPGLCCASTISVCDDNANLPLLAECISTMRATDNIEVDLDIIGTMCNVRHARLRRLLCTMIKQR
jgi:hypothetical protein